MNSKPLYIQLWEKFKNQILNNEYKYGETFPTERELEKLYGYDRKTIRKALNLLVDEKLLVRIVGKGTFVCKPDIRLSMEVLKGFSGLLRQEGVEVTTKVLFFNKVEAGYRISKLFQINTKDMVYKCVRLRYTNNVPIALEFTFIKDIFPDLLKYDLNIYSLYEIMERYGQIPSKVIEEIMGVELSEMEAQWLEEDIDDPAYLITDIMYNQNQEVIEYNRAYTRSERFVLSTKLV